jgi:hypothetical protein
MMKRLNRNSVTALAFVVASMGVFGTSCATDVGNDQSLAESPDDETPINEVPDVADVEAIPTTGWVHIDCETLYIDSHTFNAGTTHRIWFRTAPYPNGSPYGWPHIVTPRTVLVRQTGYMKFIHGITGRIQYWDGCTGQVWAAIR